MAINKAVKDLIIIGINTKLKDAKTYNDLMQIKDTIDKVAEHEIYLYFEMKKSKNLVVDFFKINDNRVEYIQDDQKSTGRSLIKNLYKNIEIVE